MAKSRRDAVEDLLGDDSPIMGALVREIAKQPEEEVEPERRAEQPSPARPKAKPPAKPAKPATPKRRKSTAANQTPSPANPKPKRCLVSAAEESAMDGTMLEIGRQVGTKVQFSPVTRAMWSLLQEAEDVMDRVQAPALKRPSNGKPEELAEYEAELAAYLLDLFHAMKQGPR